MRGNGRTGRWWRYTGTITLVLVLIASACGGSETTGSSPTTPVSTSTTTTQAPTTGTDPTTTQAPTTTTSESPPPAPHGQGTALGELLSLLPDTADSRREVVIENLALVRTQLGLPASVVGVDDDTLISLAQALDGTAIGFGNDSDLVDVSGWRTSFGFSPLEAFQVARAGVEDPIVVFNSVGHDADEIAAALAADPVWGPLLSAETLGDTTVYSWGDATETHFDRTGPGRPLGRAGTLAVTNDSVVRSYDPALLLAAVGEDPNLDRFAPFADIVQALDEAGAYAATLSADPVLFDPADSGLGEDEARALVDSSPLLGDYEALGFGGLIVDGQIRGALMVFAFADDAAAEEGAAALREVLGNGDSVYGGGAWVDRLGEPTVSTRGRLAIVELPEADRGYGSLLNAWFRRENLFWAAVQN